MAKIAKSDLRPSTSFGLTGVLAMLSGFLLLVGGLAYIAVSSLTPIYSAKAEILVDPRRAQSAASPEGTPQPLANVLNAQADLMRSGTIVAPVVTSLELASKPEWLAAGMSVDVGRNIASSLGLAGVADAIFGGTDVAVDRDPRWQAEQVVQKGLTVTPSEQRQTIQVEFSSVDAQLTADVANAIARRYVKWQAERTQNADDGTAVWLTMQIASLEEQLKNARNRRIVADSQSADGIKAVATDRSAPARSAQSARSSGDTPTSARRDGAQSPALPTAKAAAEPKTEQEAAGLLAVANARLAALEKLAKSTSRVLTEKKYDALPVAARTPAIGELIRQHGALRALRQQLEVTLLARHPRMRELRERERALDDALTTAGAQVSAQLAARIDEAKRTAAAAKKSLSKLQQQTVGAIAATVRAVKVDALDAEIATKGQLLETYRSKLEDLRGRSQSETAPVYAEVVQPAVVPAKAVFPLVWPMTALITAAALACAVLAWFVSMALSAGRARRAQAEMAAAREVEQVSAEDVARHDLRISPIEFLEPEQVDGLAIDQHVTRAPDTHVLAARLRAAAGQTYHPRGGLEEALEQTSPVHEPGFAPAHEAARRPGRKLVLRKP